MDNKEKTAVTQDMQKILEEVRNLKGSYQFSLHHEDIPLTIGNTSSCDPPKCTPSNTDACTI